MKRQRRSQFELRSYAGADLYERVLREAAARRLSVSECVRSDLGQYYAIRDELTECVQVDEKCTEGEPRRRILHTLLAEMEARLVASLDRQEFVFEQSLNVLAWMIEHTYLGLMLHLPEVPDDQRDGRLRSARMRHAAWKHQVRSRVGSTSRPFPALAEQPPPGDPGASEPPT